MNGVLSASFRRTGAVPLALNVGLCLGVHEQRDNEAIKTQDFGENENKNLARVSSWLLNSMCVLLTIPTKSLGCCAVPRTPASPTMPMANPAAKPERPTLRPAPSWMNDVKRGSSCVRLSEIRTDTTRP